MKNRKSASHDSLLNKSTLELAKEKAESRPRRKANDNPFLKKSAEILQAYKGIFSKPTHNFGDADTVFKHSLRTYDEFELNKALKWGQKHLKPNQSSEFSKLEKRLFTTPILNGEGDSNRVKRRQRLRTEQAEKERKLVLARQSSAHSTRAREVSFRVEVAEEEEPDEAELDVFYSPNSDVEVKEGKSPERRALEQSSFLEAHSEAPELDLNSDSGRESDTDSEKEFKMADDELQEAEDLVEHAGTALTELAADADAEAADADAEASDYSEADINTDAITATAESEVATGETVLSSETVGETTEVTTDASEKMASESEDEASAKPSSGQGGDASGPIEYDPNIDAAVIRELEDAEQQAMETARIIFELKQRVAQLLSKQKMTEAEGRELEQKNRQLKEQMTLFEQKTKRIQFLVDQASLFENMISPRPPLDKKHNEDMLPKVIICGTTENNMPKIIVCDDKKKSRAPTQQKTSFSLPPPPGVMPQFAKRLSESYYMQERLAAENADLEGKRYKLQEDLLDKDQTVESLQRKLHSLQGEMRMVCKENSLLTEKLERVEICPIPCSQGDTSDTYHDSQPPCKKHGKPKMSCGKNKGPCPADVESRLQEYSQTTHQLEKQLGEMEQEVRNMQSELCAVQKERQHLEQHRRMLSTPPSGPPPCAPPPCAKPPCQGPCNPARKGGASSDQQLRELREQYNRLQDDYKSKLTEVAGLRADTEKLKQSAKEAEEMKKAAEEKVKECEKEMKNYKLEKNKFMGSKEQLVEQEQQLSVAKQRFREAQDELEELRALIQDQQAQLDDYRNKYLQAQQQVEEQRRQIDMMELENNRISEQVNLEIQRVKNQFQEKLQELTPLPDILKSTQLKLQEAQQMHLLAERNNEALVHELQAYRDKAAAMANQMEKVRSDQQLGADEKATIEQRAAECERKLNEAMDENDRLKTDLARMEEIAEQNEKRVQEKLHEIAQLVSQLETVREESARQVARTKDRCETVRRSMQNQIADLERQLAQSRAQARSAQKDRDDIRQKMQSQINNLNENFEDAQMRIRNLQGHVNFLKNSYTSVFPSGDPMLSDGLDACDCGNSY